MVTKGTADSRRALRTWLRSNQALGVFLFLGFGGFLFYLNGTPSVHKRLYDGFSLGFFPMGGVMLMVIFAAVLIFDGHRKEVAASSPFFRLSTLGGCLLVAGGGYLYLELTRAIGFLIVSPIFLILNAYILGMKLKKGTIIAAVTATVLIYIVFRPLGINLPSGLLSF
jgi:hypothetical protein